MKTSVIIATYNGEKYIKELLESICKQTILPDEILIFDDKSSDGTVAIIKEFMNSKLNNIRLYENALNLGWQKNFKTGILESSGDIIFPCDQDDIWAENKIELMKNAFEMNDDIMLLVSDYRQIENDKLIDRPIHTIPVVSDADISKVEFTKLYNHILRPGCTMAIKKDLLPLFRELWKEGMPHDMTFWILANLLGKLYYIKEPLVEYRLHETNASKNINHSLFFKLEEISMTLSLSEWYLKSEYNEKDEIKNKTISKVVEFYTLRKKLLMEHKILVWFKLFLYLDSYFNKKRYLGDLYYFTLSCMCGLCDDSCQTGTTFL